MAFTHTDPLIQTSTCIFFNPHLRLWWLTLEREEVGGDRKIGRNICERETLIGGLPYATQPEISLAA